MNQKGFIPILVIILLVAAALGGFLFYQNQNTEEFKLHRDLTLQLNPNNTAEFQIETKKILNNFAIGGAGIPPQGFVWIAVKENGRWKSIWTGVNDPSCSSVSQYKIPKEIYGKCSTNY